MGWYTIRRCLSSTVVLFIVSIIAFAGLKMAPGDSFTARMSPDAIATLTPAQIQKARHALGLDAPLPVQYWKWAEGILHGEFGYSSADAIPVTSEITQHIGNTLLLMGVGLIIGLLISVPLGIMAAVRNKTAFDHVASTVPMVLVGIPGFVLGLALIFVFSVHFGLFPSAGIHTPGANSLADLAHHIVLPATVLAIGFGAPMLRYTRASMLDTLSSEFMVTARAKGLSATAITLRHGFRNALLPLITVIGLTFPEVVGGTAIIETVFGWPGMGQLAVVAAGNRDTPVVLGVVLVVAVVVIFSNLLADLAYAWADPRVRLG